MPGSKPGALGLLATPQFLHVMDCRCASINARCNVDSDADAKTVTSDSTGRGLVDVVDNRKLDINKADWAALKALPGVDADTAKKIIAKRPYKSDADISKVISSDLLRKIAPRITIDGTPVWSGPPRWFWSCPYPR